MIKDKIQLGTFFPQHAFDDRDTLGAQQIEAMTSVGRIGVMSADDDGADTGSQDRIDARRRKAMRAARLQRDVQDGVRGGLTA